MGESNASDAFPVAGFDETLGLVTTAAGPDEVVAHLDPTDELRQPYGLVHGGVYCSIVESLASVGSALYAQSCGMAGAVGVSNTTDFLRWHRDGRLMAVATPIHRGRTQQLWLVEITRDSDSKMVARGQLRTYNLPSEAVIGGASSP